MMIWHILVGSTISFIDYSTSSSRWGIHTGILSLLSLSLSLSRLGTLLVLLEVL